MRLMTWIAGVFGGAFFMVSGTAVGHEPDVDRL